MLALMLLAAGMLPAAASAQDAADRALNAQVGSERDTPHSSTKEPDQIEVTKPLTAANVDSPDLFVGAVTLAGLKAMPPSSFSDIIARHIGQTLTPAELAGLADAVAGRIRESGYPLGSAHIDPQRIQAGVLTVRVDEGTIDELRFEGASNSSVIQALVPLCNGQPVRLGDLERRLLIAGDIDGVRIEWSRFVREGDRGILLVKLAHDRISAFASLANQGTSPVGPVQSRIEFAVNGLLDSDDSVSFSQSWTPFQPRELQFGFVRYENRISAGGTEVAIFGSGSQSYPGAYLRPLGIKSRSWYFGASLSQPLQRSKSASTWLEGSISLRNLSQWRQGEMTRRDQLAVVRATIFGYRDLAGGRLRVSTTIARGLGILQATEFGDPLASRLDADGTFTALNAWTDWTSDLGGNVSLRLAAQGQLASQPLLISEEIGLGGASFLKGYDWGERTGDEGVMGMAELRYDIHDPFAFMNRAQLYGFVDAGSVSNKRNGFGSGSLATTGGGVRLDITSKLGITFEVAVPLSGPRYDTADNSAKFNFGIARAL